MLPPQDMLHAAALALREARAGPRTIERVSETHGIPGLDAAYAAGAINTRARLAEPGRRIAGLKVGLTAARCGSSSASTSRTSAFCSTAWSSSTATSCLRTD
jgi:2-keto-4-pentenoate hydratase